MQEPFPRKLSDRPTNLVVNAVKVYAQHPSFFHYCLPRLFGTVYPPFCLSYHLSDSLCVSVLVSVSIFVYLPHCYFLFLSLSIFVYPRLGFCLSLSLVSVYALFGFCITFFVSLISITLSNTVSISFSVFKSLLPCLYLCPYLFPPCCLHISVLPFLCFLLYSSLPLLSLAFLLFLTFIIPSHSLIPTLS